LVVSPLSLAFPQAIVKPIIWLVECW